jgi:hypothetical protein
MSTLERNTIQNPVVSSTKCRRCGVAERRRCVTESRVFALWVHAIRAQDYLAEMGVGERKLTAQELVDKYLGGDDGTVYGRGA